MRLTEAGTLIPSFSLSAPLLDTPDPQTPGRVHLSWEADPACRLSCLREEAGSDPPEAWSALVPWMKTKSQGTSPHLRAEGRLSKWVKDEIGD